MESAEVHLVQVELDVQLGEPVGDPGGQLARGLVGEGDDQQRLGRDALVGNEIDDALDQREGFARSGPGDDEHRAIGGQDCFQLLWICLGLEGGQASGHASPLSLAALDLPL